MRIITIEDDKCGCGRTINKRCAMNICSRCCTDKNCRPHIRYRERKLSLSKKKMEKSQVGNKTSSKKRKFEELNISENEKVFGEGSGSGEVNELKKKKRKLEKKIESLAQKITVTESHYRQQLRTVNDMVGDIRKEIKELKGKLEEKNERANEFTCFICADRVVDIQLMCCRKLMCKGCITVEENNPYLFKCHFCRKEISVITGIKPLFD